MTQSSGALPAQTGAHAAPLDTRGLEVFRHALPRSTPHRSSAPRWSRPRARPRARRLTIDRARTAAATATAVRGRADAHPRGRVRVPLPEPRLAVRTD